MNTLAKGSAMDRWDLFTETAAQRNLPPAIVEKDFWVCWALGQVTTLESIGRNLIFKGGTSLSKVFGLIERFSEDIDLSIRRDYLGFGGDMDPEKAASKTKQREQVKSLRETCREVVGATLHRGLNDRLVDQLGHEGWSLTVDPEDPGTLTFTYPASERPRRRRSSWEPLPYLKRSVKLEFGAGSDPYPVGEYLISPFAAETFPRAFKESTFPVLVLEAERTFWEKATLLHAEHHRPSDSPTPLRTSRHYYDLYRLASSDHGKRALQDRPLLERVVEHKRTYFASRWAQYETATIGQMCLVAPEARLPDIRQDYEQMGDYLYGPVPTLDEVVSKLRDLEVQINSEALTDTKS